MQKFQLIIKGSFVQAEERLRSIGIDGVATNESGGIIVCMTRCAEDPLAAWQTQSNQNVPKAPGDLLQYRRLL